MAPMGADVVGEAMVGAKGEETLVERMVEVVADHEVLAATVKATMVFAVVVSAEALTESVCSAIARVGMDRVEEVMAMEVAETVTAVTAVVVVQLDRRLGLSAELTVEVATGSEVEVSAMAATGTEVAVTAMAATGTEVAVTAMAAMGTEVAAMGMAAMVRVL